MVRTLPVDASAVSAVREGCALRPSPLRIFACLLWRKIRMLVGSRARMTGA